MNGGPSGIDQVKRVKVLSEDSLFDRGVWYPEVKGLGGAIGPG